MKASRAWRWRPHGDRIGHHHHHQPRLPQVQGEAERWPIMRGVWVWDRSSSSAAPSASTRRSGTLADHVCMELHVREADESMSKIAMVATLKLTRVCLNSVEHTHGRSNHQRIGGAFTIAGNKSQGDGLLTLLQPAPNPHQSHQCTAVAPSEATPLN